MYPTSVLSSYRGVSISGYTYVLQLNPGGIFKHTPAQIHWVAIMRRKTGTIIVAEMRVRHDDRAIINRGIVQVASG